MSLDGQGTKQRRKIAENFNRLSRVHERYRQRQTTDRQMTDGTAIAYRERELTFTFAKNCSRSRIEVRQTTLLCYHAHTVRTGH